MFIDCPGLTMFEFFKLCKEQRFRTNLIRALRKIKYKEYYLKFPIVSYNSANRTNFRIEVIQGKGLTHKGPNDRHTFNFNECSADHKSIGFLSKSGRSYLVVPCPDNTKKQQFDSGHIAQFMQKANSNNIHAFWNTIGNTFFDYFKKNPKRMFRLNTLGHDVYWLHARFTFQS